MAGTDCLKVCVSVCCVCLCKRLCGRHSDSDLAVCGEGAGSKVTSLL